VHSCTPLGIAGRINFWWVDVESNYSPFEERFYRPSTRTTSFIYPYLLPADENAFRANL